jgi:peptidyl-tRNA hydrolase, PTH2 family
MEFPDYKMYIFVNKELGMDKGKIASQVGHVVQHIVEDIFVNYTDGVKSYKSIYEDYMIWTRYHNSVKIVLKATLQELEEFKTMSYAKYIIDAGKTQIEPNSLTVVAFYPMNCKKIKHNLTRFKLL